MKHVVVIAPAKVNLALDVTGKREDGYHLIETVFQTISIYDKLTLDLTEENGIKLSSDAHWLPCNEKNLAYKAAKAFTEKTGFGENIAIHISKRIPSQAGMGGGSSDAAAVLSGMNALSGNMLSLSELVSIGAGLGADVPFFLYGGTAYAEGIGEKLEVLPPLRGLCIVSAKGKGGISTPEAYRRIDALIDPVHPDTQSLKQAIKSGESTNSLWRYCGNIFEEVTELEDVTDIKNIMIKNGADFACMSGSGSSVFGIFRNYDMARKCRNVLSRKYPFAALCTTTGKNRLYK